MDDKDLIDKMQLQELAISYAEFQVDYQEILNDLVNCNSIHDFIRIKLNILEFEAKSIALKDLAKKKVDESRPKVN